jgi:hypothetical protein
VRSHLSIAVESEQKGFFASTAGLVEPKDIHREAAMIKSGKRSLMFLSAASLVLWVGHAESQQEPQSPTPQNPYMMGSEGYGKGPRGLTSFQPIAIVQPFAARMAADVAAKAGVEREHQALLDERYDLADHPA